MRQALHYLFVNTVNNILISEYRENATSVIQLKSIKLYLNAL